MGAKGDTNLLEYAGVVCAAVWLLVRVLIGNCNLRDEQHALGLDC